jgi:acetyltransferase-like isoleucine patch superfamily enzyme
VNTGVTIGDRCVIGANSVVTKDVPSGTIAAGVPARVLREIDFAPAVDSR